MRKTNLICLAAIVLAVGVGWADGGELRPVECDPDSKLFPGVMLQGRVRGKGETKSAGLSSRAITGELKLPNSKPGDKKDLGIRFALDYSKEGAANPDLLLVDFNASDRFDRAKAITLRPEKTQKGISYQAQFEPASVSAMREGKTFPLLIRGAVLGLGMNGGGRKYIISAFVAPAVQGKCRFGQTEYTIRLIDNTVDFRFDCKGAYDPMNPGPMRMGTGNLVLVDTGDGTFSGSFIQALYGQPLNVDGQWYKLSVSTDGSQASAVQVKVAAGELQIEADKWELLLHRDGELSLLVGGRDPLPIPTGKYDIMYCCRWSSTNDAGQRSFLLAGDTEFSFGQGASYPISVAAGEKTTLPLGSPLSTSMTATAKGETVEFSLKTPTIRPGLSVVFISSDEGDPLSPAEAPKVIVSDANGKAVNEFSMEYG